MKRVISLARAKHTKRFLIGLAVFVPAWAIAFFLLSSTVALCVSVAYAAFCWGSLVWYRVGIEDGIEIVHTSRAEATKYVERNREAAPWN